jgi:hypothetical protein
MVALVTLSTVKAVLRVEEIDADKLLSEFADMATGIMLNYLKISEVDNDWTVDDVPDSIKMGILLMVQAMYDGENIVLNQNVKDLVHRYRDPTLA